MIGKLQMTTLFGPRLRAGSSSATVSSGCGEKNPACAGLAGSAMSTACNPPECHESSTRCGSTVRLWVEYDVNCWVAGSTCDWNAWVFWKILNSPTICGVDGSRTSIRRIQPHGQPNDGAVKVP